MDLSLQALGAAGLRSASARGPQAAGVPGRARGGSEPSGEPDGPGRTGRVIEERGDAARQRLAERAENALRNAETPHQRRHLERRIELARNALESRVQNALSRLDPDTAGAPTGDGVQVAAGGASAAGASDAEAPSNPGAGGGTTQVDRRLRLAARLAAAQGSSALPEAVLDRLGRADGAGTGSATTPREDGPGRTGRVLEERGAEALARLDERVRNALGAADSARAERRFAAAGAARRTELEARIAGALGRLDPASDDGARVLERIAEARGRAQDGLRGGDDVRRPDEVPVFDPSEHGVYEAPEPARLDVALAETLFRLRRGAA